jgi:hypothetical protein
MPKVFSKKSSATKSAAVAAATTIKPATPTAPVAVTIKPTAPAPAASPKGIEKQHKTTAAVAKPVIKPTAAAAAPPRMHLASTAARKAAMACTGGLSMEEDNGEDDGPLETVPAEINQKHVLLYLLLRSTDIVSWRSKDQVKLVRQHLFDMVNLDLQGPTAAEKQEFTDKLINELLSLPFEAKQVQQYLK